jgi:hypothetical protein
MSIARLDIDSAVDRIMFLSGYGNMMAFPSLPGTTSTAGTGVPTNGTSGFAPGCLFLNYKATGGAGSVLYVNSGTSNSSAWSRIV